MKPFWTSSEVVLTELPVRILSWFAPFWMLFVTVVLTSNTLWGPSAQTCTFEGPAFKNTTKIPREDIEKREERKKKRELLGPHLSGPGEGGPSCGEGRGGPSIGPT